jgi:hypothetical protein
VVPRTVLDDLEKRKISPLPGLQLQYRVLLRMKEGKGPVENLDIGGRIILKYILEKYDQVA